MVDIKEKKNYFDLRFIAKSMKMVNWKTYITTDEEVLLGKPHIKDTRLSVEFIVERLASGWTEEDLLENYPRLTKEALKAVFSYIYDCLKDGLLYIPLDKRA